MFNDLLSGVERRDSEHALDTGKSMTTYSKAHPRSVGPIKFGSIYLIRRLMHDRGEARKKGRRGQLELATLTP
jgi:hypothetical protein